MYELQKQQGAEAELPPLSDEEEDDDEDEQEDEEETRSVAAADDDDDAAGGVAIAPPPPAPPGTEGLSDQLRYALDVLRRLHGGERWMGGSRSLWAGGSAGGVDGRCWLEKKL